MENKKSLYREYRPKNFDQVAGHEGIKEILISQIKTNSFGHALLFSGQRGTGKTSIAKIFAKVVNCQNLDGYNPCDECLSCKEFNSNSHSDIFEIDAASNNGVEEIRNIKSNISLLPSFSKYKVYIIDEVHMLSNSAFNALLKTLEEPPKHVLFVLATTEFSKIPATIISRCQLFNFKRIAQISLENKVNEICEKEGKKITQDALNEIYYMSDGSLRDALNYLEQSITISTEEVNIEILKKIFYIATKNEKIEIIRNVIEGKTKEIISYFEKANNQGIDFQTMTLSLLNILKEIIEVKLTEDINFLVNINENDYEFFKNIDIKIFFDLSDNIADSYTKSKNSNISFQYILINILKTVANKQLISVLKSNELNDNFSIIHENNLEISKVKIVGPEIVEPEIVEPEIVEPEIVEPEIVEPEIVEPEIVEEQNIERNNEEKPKLENEINDFFISEDESKFLKLQMKLLISESNYYKNIIDFTNDQIINVLVGANKESRGYYEEKFNNIFSPESINNNSEYIQNFIMFYGTKITAASADSLIIVSEERTISKWINNKLQNEKNRKLVFSYFKREVKIICLDKKRWAEIKIDFMDRKNNNKLNNYSTVSTEEFYSNLTLNIDEEENEYLKRAKELLGNQNIKVVD
ncbi:DNA polymerase III subunit gamma/tau [Spiroplasma diminutum]|uniref:DNA polymerase III subunit gamma/tau n=1 Tax=Spiroplasma diminutum CUAS-1 TaxID=1276221 RepID=S5LYU1_9MOLU|nr:DNA polymerase III subunit gamma/tau [Spiroplasma diminutum]AGR41711.1 DNA polymerase III subunits gamma and tau [Spiroplasma diminutum CUAS-1]